MGQRITAIDDYIAKQQPFAQPILVYLRELVHEACPEVREVIKWGHPNFDYKGPFAGMAAFKAHATFGFWKHALLAEGRPTLGKSEATAMGSFGRLSKLGDLPSRRTLVTLLRTAMKFNEDGVPNPTRTGPRQPVVLRPPAFFLSAVRARRAALATWEGLPPGQRREYVEWVTEAKTAPTRERRMATTVQWLSEGKRRNWKYQKR